MVELSLKKFAKPLDKPVVNLAEDQSGATSTQIIHQPATSSPDDHAENLHETESTMAMDVDSNTGIDRCSQPAAASMDFAVSPFPDCNTAESHIEPTR